VISSINGSIRANFFTLLRRYKRRWIVGHTFAWLGNFRRLVVRHDRSLTIYQAFFHIACFMIVLRRVLK
jgi:transposase